jgi:ABC-type multidrug transport system permease subunit
MIPPDRLHPVLQTIGYLSPATYAASALRHVLLGQPEPISLAADVVVLLLVMAGLLTLSARRMVWRM